MNKNQLFKVGKEHIPGIWDSVWNGPVVRGSRQVGGNAQMAGWLQNKYRGETCCQRRLNRWVGLKRNMQIIVRSFSRKPQKVLSRRWDGQLCILKLFLLRGVWRCGGEGGAQTSSPAYCVLWISVLTEPPLPIHQHASCGYNSLFHPLIPTLTIYLFSLLL